MNAMQTVKTQTLPLHSPAEIVSVRQAVREWAGTLGFGLVGQTKLVVTAGELARHTFTHGNGGTLRLSILEKDSCRGLEMVFEDDHPGISDVLQRLQSSYASDKRTGSGSGCLKRQADDIEIVFLGGYGSPVTVRCWKIEQA